MPNDKNAVEISGLCRKFGKTIAVNNLSLRAPRGKCYGFFGRNGAGKTTTIRCMLNLLQPDSGEIRIFGKSPKKDETAVKSRLGYVPEVVAFYPWMTVRGTLDFISSFRDHWNSELEKNLLERFDLDPGKKVTSLSRGMKAQLSLLCAICPEPDLLLLDEPTSGLDPIVRRDFIKTVIGAFQEGDPENRTMFISTHLIGEFEGLIDEFTIIEAGRDILSLDADQARGRFKKIKLRFEDQPPTIKETGIVSVYTEGRDVEVVTSDYSEALKDKLASLSPKSLQVETLRLEEIFIAAVGGERKR